MLSTIWMLLRWVWHAIKRRFGPGGGDRTRHFVASVEMTCSCGKKFEMGGCKEEGE